MSDLDKVKALLTEFGVPFTLDTEAFQKSETGASTRQSIMVTNNHNCEKITGYSRFFTTFEFDESGKFICMGAWE